MTILKKLTNLENEAATFGFKWENPHQIIEQIKSECQEISEQLSQSDEAIKCALQEEIGDLLHAAFSLCVFCNFDPKETLKNSVDKFERRFLSVKEIAKKQGLDTLNEKSVDELMKIWDLVKATE